MTTLQQAASAREIEELQLSDISLARKKDPQEKINTDLRNKKACEEYLIHLKKAIEQGVKKIFKSRSKYDQYSFQILLISELKLNQNSTTKEIADTLITKYLAHPDREIIYHSFIPSSHQPLKEALQKYKVVTELQKCNNFYQKLEQNKELLAKRRDTGFMTFVKALGLVAAVALGLVGCGVGAALTGYYAYHSLFGEKATVGKLFYKKIKREDAVGSSNPSEKHGMNL